MRQTASSWPSVPVAEQQPIRLAATIIAVLMPAGKIGEREEAGAGRAVADLATPAPAMD